MPFNIFHSKWTLIFTLKSIHLFSLIDQVMMTYYMQGHESQVNRLRNSYFDKNSKVKPTLSCEYYWDGWHYRRYNVHGPRATSQDEIQSFLQLKDFPNFQACALGLPPEATTLKLEEAQGAGLPVLHIWTNSLLLQIGHSSPFSTTVHTIGLIYDAILHIFGALIMRKYTLDHHIYLIQNGG
jgi:hypothetical protein